MIFQAVCVSVIRVYSIPLVSPDEPLSEVHYMLASPTKFGVICDVRLLEDLCSCRSEGCNEYIMENFSVIKNLLLTTVSAASLPSRGVSANTWRSLRHHFVTKANYSRRFCFSRECEPRKLCCRTTRSKR